MKLDTQSSIDPQRYPFLSAWDKTYRSSYAMYQNQIDRLTFHLQKARKAFYPLNRLFYPVFYQKDLILLELYRRKQALGAINPEEVKQYSKIDPNISHHLKKTFNTEYYLPLKGLTAGAGIFAFCHIFNFQYSLRAGLLLIALAGDLAFHWIDKTPYFRSIEFLDFALAYRKAKGRLEYFKKEGEDVERLRKVFKGRSLDEVYEEIVDFASRKDFEADLDKNFNVLEGLLKEVDQGELGKGLERLYQKDILEYQGEGKNQ